MTSCARVPRRAR